ncbi:ABC-F family ATP-binding cassette domain-containing protein, partial [Brevundimonas sp.]
VAARTTDGSSLFENLDLTVSAERIGVVGANGSGKSTLLDLIAHKRMPDDGHVSVTGTVVRLDQQTGAFPDMSVATALGVDEEWARINRILEGVAGEDDLERADWGLEARLDKALLALGLTGLDPARPMSSLSGGERTRVYLAGLKLAQPDIVLLDEPTNHMDAEGREAVMALVRDWEGCLIVASHDRDLLQHVDRIVELSPLGPRIYGGNYDLYRTMRDAERLSADAALTQAKRAMDSARQEAQSQREARDRRDGAGKRASLQGGQPKILLGRRKGIAQQSSGRENTLADRKMDALQSDLSQAQDAVACTRNPDIRINSTGLGSGREIVRLEQAVLRRGGRILVGPVDMRLGGPFRLAITGPNGAGKSTLMALLSGQIGPDEGLAEVLEPAAVLDQDVSLLHPDETVRDAWLRLNPGSTPQQAQAALAGFLFRNTAAMKRVGELSGGERLRAGLACVLGGEKPARYLLLDEPTNHLDIPSVEAIETALADYDGALVVISHDRRFLEAIGIEQVWDLTPAVHRALAT